jgi:hypothetical protein
MLPVLGGMAQSRDVALDIAINSVPGDNLAGQQVTVTQTDYQVGYGTLKLDSEGKCSTKIYPGNHLLELQREGFLPVSYSFVATSGSPVSIELTLEESTRDPYSLTATPIHDALTGRNDLSVTWNTEQPAFFDDFESYDAFSIKFGDWTGIDGDGEAAAALVGSYPNRGVMQYAQIINPITVSPTWWYDYPVLRPYSGQQYVGFVRTSSGNSNDDWLISPEITVGVANQLSFLAKAADAYPERFMVYITTKTDNPGVDDFVRLDKDNYESVEYKSWQEFSYDLSAYEGQKIKFAIRYIGDYNRYGSFMLMVDDVYVGQVLNNAAEQMARRVKRSPANANERFEIMLDGEKVGETDSYSYLISDVAAGDHTVGVRALYLNAQSEVTQVNVAVGADKYAHLTLNVTADSKLSPDGETVNLLSLEDGEQYSQTVAEGKAEWLSLPAGRYDISVEEGAYNAFLTTVEVNEDMEYEVALTDNVQTPYNITAKVDDEGNATIRWNQTEIFSDSFEDYEDFASGEFGDWVTLDVDGLPVYPIGLGSTSNIVSFPGSGTATNPLPLAPLVFNPWNTTPAMLPTDPAIAAPTGEKMIMFNSAQGGRSDKWLISPAVDLRDGFQASFLAKAYSIYPETMEVWVSNGSVDPADFKILAEIDDLPNDQWAMYQIDLSEFAEQSVRVGIRYTSYDAFLAQVDDVTIGPASGEGELVDYGNVVNYEVYLDGELIGSPTEQEILIPNLSDGEHTVDIYAIYQNRRSDKGSYTFTVSSGVMQINAEDAAASEYYDLLGRKITNPGGKGIFIRRSAGVATKIMK